MDYIEYKKVRESIGTQALVAGLLDISVMTLSRRELGKIPLSREAKAAMLSLTGKAFKYVPSGKVAENIKKSVPVQETPYTEKAVREAEKERLAYSKARYPSDGDDELGSLSDLLKD